MSGSNTVGTTSVPAPTMTDAGFVAPAESDILAGILADMNAAFGNVLNTDLSTPQGQLAMSLTAIVGDAYDQMLALFNGVDPARAWGRMQDAIGNLYFITRKPATATVVTCQCVGAAGAIVPQGTLVQDGSANTYAANGPITLDGTGYGSGTFSCTVMGAVECPPGSIGVYQSVVGLTSVTNAAAGVTGRAVEGRQAFELRRQQTVAHNAMGPLDALAGEVLSTPGVTDAYVCENSAANPVSVGGVTLPAHSLYVCVNGGLDADVALAILRKKPPGCASVGNSRVVVVDPNAAYATPPEYTVQFTRAQAVPVYVAVVLAGGVNVPSTAVTDVQAAIVAGFAGATGAERVAIGGTVYASNFYTSVSGVGDWVKIVGITVGLAAQPTVPTVALTIEQIPVVSTATISVQVV
ncbi:baseplate J/gp47 family protein [Acetobacter sp. LMG 32666]|uniref:baseplate J/gp47 family protein n=1 Tax=Acetobacter sp. LMG 32666 TaxID=2959295 RepID=UPI0030C7D083